MVLIYAKYASSRLIYVLDFIFGKEYKLTTGIDEYLNYSGAKINYSEKKEEDQSGLFLPPSTNLLFETDIQLQLIEVIFQDDCSYFFKSKNIKSDFPFDIFASVFLMLTRYEEYLPGNRDQHKRFRGTDSIGYQFNFLQQPVVDIWIKKLFSHLQSKAKNFDLKQNTIFHFQATYDIDMAWSFRNKGFLRTVGGLLRDLKNINLKNLIFRFNVLTGIAPDPFDSFAFLERIHQKYKISPIYFFLLADLGKYDKNINPKNPAFQDLIQKIHQKYFIGIHPSYQAAESENVLRKEVRRLNSIIGTEVVKSRQHFLRLSFPQTYQQLLKNGIREDYTMGYADCIGFRAGTAQSFFWFDLTNNTVTDLKVYPFQIMDVTLRNYLKISPQVALFQAKKMIDTIRQTGGTFTTLWHNSSFAENEGWTENWQSLYEEIVKYAVTVGDEQV